MDSLVTSGVGRIRRYPDNAARQAAYRKRHTLPAALLSRDRWVRHVAKRPVTIMGAPASSTDSGTWSSYPDAKASAVGDGLGFVLGNGVACIDIDSCLVGGKADARALAVLARFPDAYVEVSPSGSGLHVWGSACEQPGRKHAGYEVYSAGRYITVTRVVFRAGGLPDISAAF
jgi:primase-polymerase (primpol)-like protein